MDEIKKKIIPIIEEMKIENSFKRPVVEFIKTYDGSNEAEFIDLVDTVIKMFCDLGELQVRASGYDMLKEVRDEFSSSLNRSKKIYSDTISDKTTQDYPVE